MNILIVANFTRDFSATDNGRFLYLAKKLSAENHKVELVTNDFNHGKKERRKAISAEYSFKITMLHEPGYKKNVSLQRFWSHHVWGRNLKKYIQSIPKPDVVYCAVPSLSGPNYVADYCEKNHIRFVIDIQDLWPEAFQMVVTFPGSGVVFWPVKKLADAIYSRADAICAVSRTFVDRALSVNRKCTDGTAVYLGTELSNFDAYAVQKPQMEKQPGELWLGYCGSLGSSYDLPCVFDALEILKNREITLKFVVMGNGPRQKEFENCAKEKGLDVVFTGRLPYDKMCALLCRCDMTVNPILGTSAASIINKHADYAACALPVVNTQQSEEYKKLVDEYGMGFNCNNHDSAALAAILEELVRDEALRKRMGRNARRCAEERFDRKNSYQALIREITG